MITEIRLGRADEIDAIEQLYNDLNDYLEATVNYPGWKKGVYPTRQEAVEGVAEGCLYVVMRGETLVGSMILRCRQEPAYSTVTWQVQAKSHQVLVLYTFVVAPGDQKKGIGEKMIEFAVQQAREKQLLAMRLDVYEHNTPAIRLYERFGFQYIDTVSLGLEAYGLNGFRLYERLTVGRKV